MSEKEKNLPPRIYHTRDPDGVFALWKSMVDFVTTDMRSKIALFQEIVDPDTTPAQYLDIMLASLGNPFKKVFLTETQKRKLVKLLIPMYRQIGTARGIVNAVRFLTGIEVEILDPHADPNVGWQIGVSEIGLSTYAGGERIYCNILKWTEDLDEADWIKTNCTVTPDAVNGPAPWGTDADALDMSTPGAEVRQTVTPLEVGEEEFTGSFWIKATAPGTLQLQLQSPTVTSDEHTEDISVTTSWQRFEIHHQFLPSTTGNVDFAVKAPSGFAGTVYIWGGQVVRDDEVQPYVRALDSVEDCEHVGKWAYHFFIQSPVDLTENEEMIVRMVADFVKPAHTHYTIIQPTDLGFINHWEVGISQVGENTWIH